MIRATAYTPYAKIIKIDAGRLAKYLIIVNNSINLSLIIHQQFFLFSCAVFASIYVLIWISDWFA